MKLLGAIQKRLQIEAIEHSAPWMMEKPYSDRFSTNATVEATIEEDSADENSIDYNYIKSCSSPGNRDVRTSTEKTENATKRAREKLEYSTGAKSTGNQSRNK